MLNINFVKVLVTLQVMNYLYYFFRITNCFTHEIVSSGTPNFQCIYMKKVRVKCYSDYSIK